MIDYQIQLVKNFIQSFSNANVKHAVISPGSRSTPLILELFIQKNIENTVIIDERSAAFYALGQARITGMPSLLICTSGSAGTHYYPAIVEASKACIPLIVITADRPWELQQCGSNQTIFQHNLFGSHVRSYLELGEADPCNQGAGIQVASKAVLTSLYPKPGPVHINARFRKPLEYDPVNLPPTQIKKNCQIKTFSNSATIDIEQLITACAESSKGIIVCGPSIGAIDLSTKNLLSKIALKMGFGIFAETASGLRGLKKHDNAISNYSFLLDTNFFKSTPPDLIIEIYSPLTASSYGNFIKDNLNIPRIIITPYEYNDPFSNASLCLMGQINEILKSWENLTTPKPTSTYLKQLQKIDSQIDFIIQNHKKTNSFDEASATCAIAETIPKNSVLMPGNSQVIRDFDNFTNIDVKTVLHQRGASGIDGMISGAAGSAHCADSPLVLVTGDMSIRHDLSALTLLHKLDKTLIIIIINNNGGRIFQHLPIGKIKNLNSIVSDAFILPGEIPFDFVKSMNISYHCVDSAKALKQAILSALKLKKPSVINAIITDPDSPWRRKLSTKTALCKP